MENGGKNSLTQAKWSCPNAVMCFFLLPCIPPRATTCKLIDCTTIKGKLTATRKPCQATALGGESLLSSESSKSLISDVFLLYSVPKAFRSFLFVCYSYTRLIKGRASLVPRFFSRTYLHTHTYTCIHIYCPYESVQMAIEFSVLYNQKKHHIFALPVLLILCLLLL